MPTIDLNISQKWRRIHHMWTDLVDLETFCYDSLYKVYESICKCKCWWQVILLNDTTILPINLIISIWIKYRPLPVMMYSIWPLSTLTDWHNTIHVSIIELDIWEVAWESHKITLWTATFNYRIEQMQMNCFYCGAYCTVT